MVKVYIKHDASIALAPYAEMLSLVRERLNSAPNVMPFRWFRETSHAAYLVRQYFYSNLLERMSTPPFLSSVEKRWIAFQLLQATQQCHAAGVCHGDIKPENVMITSWNWVYLVDLANFKPNTLPQDDPSDFNYFFAAEGRRACALAPERFAERAPPAAKEAPQPSAEGLRPASDVFSCGCVLLELFLDGGPPFELPQLLRYVSRSRFTYDLGEFYL